MPKVILFLPKLIEFEYGGNPMTISIYCKHNYKLNTNTLLAGPCYKDKTYCQILKC